MTRGMFLVGTKIAIIFTHIPISFSSSYTIYGINHALYR